MSFDDVLENNSSNNTLPNFFLANDKESAFVRIMHTSAESFDGPYTVHAAKIITKTGKTWTPKVNCLRAIGQDSSACPFCAAGNDLGKIQSIVHINLIKYTVDATGNVTNSEPMVWERGASWVKHNLLPTIEAYGESMPTTLVKITRVGAKGDTQTSYTITPLPPTYTVEQFPMDCAEAFADYTTLGTNILDKSFSEMMEYVQTGKFPFNNVNATPNAQASNVSAGFTPVQNNVVANEELPFPQGTPQYQTVPSVPNAVAPQPVANIQPQPAVQTKPWQTNAPANRPTRKYN